MLKIKEVERTTKFAMVLIDFDWKGEIYTIKRGISLQKLADMTEDDIKKWAKEKVTEARDKLAEEATKEKFKNLIGVNLEEEG